MLLAAQGTAGHANKSFACFFLAVCCALDIWEKHISLVFLYKVSLSFVSFIFPSVFMRNIVDHTCLKPCLCHSEYWLGICIARKSSGIVAFSQNMSVHQHQMFCEKETVPAVVWGAFFSARKSFGWFTVQLLLNVMLRSPALLEISSSVSWLICLPRSWDPKDLIVRFRLYLRGGSLWIWDFKTRKLKTFFLR